MPANGTNTTSTSNTADAAQDRPASRTDTRQGPRGPDQGPQRRRLVRPPDRRARPSTFPSAPRSRSPTASPRSSSRSRQRTTANRELKSIRTRVERELNRLERRGAGARRKTRTRVRRTRNRVERELKQRRRKVQTTVKQNRTKAEDEPEARPEHRPGAGLRRWSRTLSPGRLERWRARRDLPAGGAARGAAGPAPNRAGRTATSPPRIDRPLRPVDPRLGARAA